MASSLIAVILLSSACATRDADWGPLFRMEVTPLGQIRTTAAGPFYENRWDDAGHSLTALRPFYSVSHASVRGFVRREYLWPLAQSTLFRGETSWRVLIAYGRSKDGADTQGSYRVRVYPFYFAGRDASGRTHRALFPVGGVIHNFLGRDEIEFVLFPLWMRHSVNEVVTTDWLFPILSYTSGGFESRFRIFPLYGYSHREGQHRKRFILWPIWTQSEWLHPESGGHGYILFPLWGRIRLPHEQTLMLIPPLFRFTRGDRQDLIHAPWPFFQYAHGDEIDKLYLWPLWGRKTIDNVYTQFFLWPFISTRRIERAETTYTDFRLLPFVQTRTERWNQPAVPGEKPEVVNHAHRVWPLWYYERDGESGSFSTLALWPVRSHGVIERNWAPLWTIYRREFSETALDSELLWGLYQHSRRGQLQRSWSVFPLFSWERDDRETVYRKWSLLRGLAGYERVGGSRRYRLLYLIRFGGKEAESS